MVTSLQEERIISQRQSEGVTSNSDATGPTPRERRTSGLRGGGVKKKTRRRPRKHRPGGAEGKRGETPFAPNKERRLPDKGFDIKSFATQEKKKTEKRAERLEEPGREY